MAWKHIRIPNGKTSLFCNVYIKSIVKDLNSIVRFIQKNVSPDIHLYGNTGIGGMFAQYYATTSSKIKSFAQFACVRYKDTSGDMGYPYPAVWVLTFFLRHLPSLHIPLKPPKYNGYRQEEDNAFYENLTKKHPDIWKANSKMLNTLMECFIAKNSAARNSVAVPTLVFKVLHDRYFSPQYFDNYFQSLTCEKKLVEINGVHNSYLLDSELFCKHVVEWFAAHSK